MTMTDTASTDFMLHDPEKENQDGDLAHIVNPPMNLHIWTPGMDMYELVDIAREKKIEVTALCGLVFIPKKDPDPLPACSKCLEIAGELMRSKGE